MKNPHNHDMVWLVGATLFLIYGGIVAGCLIYGSLKGAGIIP